MPSCDGIPPSLVLRTGDAQRAPPIRRRPRDRPFETLPRTRNDDDSRFRVLPLPRPPRMVFVVVLDRGTPRLGKTDPLTPPTRPRRLRQIAEFRGRVQIG